MRKIRTLNDIDYKTFPEGRLLFTALTIFTTDNYKDKTPDEVIEILNEKSAFLDHGEQKDFSERIQSEMEKLNKKENTELKEGESLLDKRVNIDLFKIKV